MAKATGAETPVMRQYLAAKAAHPDCIVFFRLGDFYELFFEDAVVTANALELTLTSRNKNADDPIPMCGVPYHAASGYLQRLLDQGYKVAICEQMADPSKVKGIVPREVVRIVTPSMPFDDGGLEASKNLFLCALEGRGDASAIGAAMLDVSTGELFAFEADGPEAALAELTRLEPREVLAGPGTEALVRALRAALPRLAVRETPEVLASAAAVALLDGLLGEGEARRATSSDLGLVAAARCVALAQSCEPGRPLAIPRLVELTLGDTLVLDEATQRHLELARRMDGEFRGSLLSQIDLTKTAPGARLLRRRLLAPRTRVAQIRRRLDAVELLVTQPGLRAEVRQRLTRVADMERLAVKVAMAAAATARVSPRDLDKLRTSLAELPLLDASLRACPDKGAREALEVPEGAPFVDGCEETHDLVARALAPEPPLRASDGGVFREGYDAELDEARRLTHDGQALIAALEGSLRDESKIGSLKLRYTRVFGWYIEVTKSHLAKVPSAWRRKQTVATGERYTCDALDDLASKLAHAEERLSARESELWTDLCARLASHAERLREVAVRLSALDVAAALAELAHRDDYVRPDVNESLDLLLEDARHPVVEKLAAAGRFVPNDVELDADPDAPADKARMWIVTGPNMAGKSTFMRQVALIVVMAQMGSFVPARRARIGVVDRVLTRVGASDNLALGESTFMVEMKETANIVRRATRRSLVVLDEIGRGTSTYDGLSIAWAVAEHLHDVCGSRALFATHYHELTELTLSCPRAENHSVSAREHAGDIVFFHKVQRGAASRSYGVACARIAGLPEPVLARARAILEGLERDASLPTATSDGDGGASGASARSPRPRRGGAAADGQSQLGLFGGASAAAPAAPAESPALDMLRALDVERITPLEAIVALAKLKGLAGQGQGQG